MVVFKMDFFFSLISFGYVCTLCFVLFIIVFCLFLHSAKNQHSIGSKWVFKQRATKRKSNTWVLGFLSSYYYASSSWYRGKQLQFSVIFLIVLLFAPEVRCGSTMDSNAEILVRTTLSKVQKKWIIKKKSVNKLNKSNWRRPLEDIL